MRHVSILILLAVVEAALESPGTVPAASECAVSLLQTEFKLTKARPDPDLQEKPPHWDLIQALEDVIEEPGKGREKADVMPPELFAEQDNMATKLDLMAWPHLFSKGKADSAGTAKQNNVANKLELKASSEYANESSPRQASSKEQSKSGVVNVRLNSELQTNSTKKDSNVPAQSTASRLAVNETATNEAESWVASETLAWLQVKLQKSIGAPVFILFAGVLTCMCTMMLLTAKWRDGNRKDNDDWPLSLHRAHLGSRFMMPGGGSQVPTQQSLIQQRTPLVSSSVLQPGGSMMQGLQQQAPGDDFELPPICPSLILPHTDARFVINMNHLKRSWLGPLDILGTSGRKLLDALVCDAPGGRRCLMLASCGCGDDPRTCIFTAQPGSIPRSTDSQALEIFGKAGKFYGWLEFPGGSEVLLSHSSIDGKSRRVLRIEMGSASDLRMSASTRDGRVLATAGRSAPGQSSGQQFEGVDIWKMEVKPGIDAVLITSCMLALIFLRSWPAADGRMSLAANTAAGTSTSLRQQPSPRTSIF